MRLGYLTTVRAKFDYGCGVWFPMCAPSVKQTIEAEQNACIRLWTGCIRLTNTKALTGVAGLPTLTHRAEERAAVLMERVLRLPDDIPARQVAEDTPRPRLKSRAGEAHKRKCREAREEGRDVPEPETEDALLEYRPCWRRTALRVIEEAGLAGFNRESTPVTSLMPPWAIPAVESVQLNPSLGEGVSKKTPETIRLRQAMEALQELPPAEWNIYTDGSAQEAVYNGGAGVFIEAPDNTTTSLMAPAGAMCSSYRAELTALETALEYLAENLPASTEGQRSTVRICTDSKSAIQRLEAGPTSQTCAKSNRVWSMLCDLADRAQVTIQWVPGHTGVPGNERADVLAGEACSEPQDMVPLDLDTATAAIKRRTRTKAKERALSHAMWSVSEGGNKWEPVNKCRTRLEEVIVNQLRTGYCPLVRETLYRIGAAADPYCLECGTVETVKHMLQDCGAWEAPRAAIFGVFPSLHDILQLPDKLNKFLRLVGRDKPPLVERDNEPQDGNDAAPADIRA